MTKIVIHVLPAVKGYSPEIIIQNIYPGVKREIFHCIQGLQSLEAARRPVGGHVPPPFPA
jgi:hypothetical protein